MSAYRSIFLDEGWAHQAHFGWSVVKESHGLRILSQTRYGIRRFLALVEGAGVVHCEDWLAARASEAWRNEIVVHDFNGVVDPQHKKGFAFAPAQSDSALLNTKTMVVDLTAAEDTILSAMSSDYRRKIRKAEKLGATFDVMQKPDADTIDEFVDLQHALATERGFLPASRSNLERMYATGDAILCRVRLDDDVSYLHLYLTRTKAIFMYSAARERGSQGIGQFLHWCSMKALKMRGIEWYDLGGVKAFDDSNGIYRFKRMFGAVEVDLGREWVHRGKAARTARAVRSLVRAT